MFRIQSALATFVLLVLLSACGTGAGPLPPPAPVPTPTPTPTPGGQSISGTVYAPAGGDLAGAFVVACEVVGQEFACDTPTSQEVALGAGASAPYSFANLNATQYVVLAAKDVDNDGGIDSVGDYFGAYSLDGVNLAPVAPPITGIDFTLVTL